jgi:zinc protease
MPAAGLYSMKRGRILIAGLALAMPAVARTQAPAAPVLPVTRFTLPNGLVVVIHENRTAPVANVSLWFHVGAKDDPPGRWNT